MCAALSNTSDILLLQPRPRPRKNFLEDEASGTLGRLEIEIPLG